jgi:MFS family permease
MSTLDPLFEAPHTPSNEQTDLRGDAKLIALVGIAHLVSHFSQLVLPPLFPWIKEGLHVSYAELGSLMSIFFVVSCAVQALSGFAVDRFGPRPLLFLGLAFLVFANFGYALSESYSQMTLCAFIAGMGNGVFHPADYTLINQRVRSQRIGHAYSIHGLTGSLGWALAPTLMVPLALAYSWHVALFAAGLIALAVLILLWFKREDLSLDGSNAELIEVATTLTNPGANAGSITGSIPASNPNTNSTRVVKLRDDQDESAFAFLKIPVVWMCFAFFLFYSMALSIVQAYAPEAVRHLQSVPLSVTASCLTVYMLCSAAGVFLGGFLASNPQRAEKVVGLAFLTAGLLSLSLVFLALAAWQVIALFGLMGLISGSASPSRDLLVKQSTPANSTGRVYGVVYSGLDIGQAISAFIFGVLMDHQNYSAVIVGLACLQGILVIGALNVRRVQSNPV